MSGISNPAAEAFVRTMGEEIAFGQVLIRRVETHFELRHEADRDVPSEALRRVLLDELRGIAAYTERGAFRPLKSAPDLRRGWITRANDVVELDRALNQLYPGALADWYTAQSEPWPVTPFRAFAERQTGMYRITAKLTDGQAGRVVQVACDKRFCLKRRLWSVGELPADAAGEKSNLPCFEPCAILLEFARKAMRIEQEPQLSAELSQSDWRTVLAALESTLQAAEHETDLAGPLDAWRVRLVLEKLRHLDAGRARSDVTEGTGPDPRVNF